MTLFEALSGGAFDRLKWQHSGDREMRPKFFKKVECPGICSGGGGGWAVLELTGTLNGFLFKFVKNGTGKAPARLATFGMIVSLLCKTSRLHVAVSLFSGKSQNVVGTTR